MKRSRIATGFHRLGIVIAFIFGIPAGIAYALAVASYFDYVPGAVRDFWQICAMIAVIATILAAVGYVASRAIGWIIAGFARGDDFSN